jgi:peptide chain release factor 2
MLEEEELLTQAPDFWSSQAKAEEQMRKVKSLKMWLDLYSKIEKSVEELNISMELFKENIISEKELESAYNSSITLIENLEMKNMLGEEEDKLGAVLKIVAGAGGTEAQDWAQMLLRMYMRWAEANGFKAEITNLLNGDEAGIKTVTMQIEGEFAYGYLKSENGVHRLVRVSPFNAQGKRMTSFTSVFVTPLIDNSIEIEINPANLSWDTFRSSGAGGQNVNKVETGVRLHYKFKNPVTEQQDEIVIENTESRSQLGNKENAIRLLKSQLYELELEKRRNETAKIEAGKKKIEWGSQIRSYVFDDRRVKDHRTNFQTSNVQAVMDGELEPFIKAYLMEF